MTSATVEADSAVRWNLKISKDADRSVRSLLAQRGLKKGDLSKFVEDAVKWRVFEMNLERIRSGFSDMNGADLDALISEAVTAARAGMRVGKPAQKAAKGRHASRR